MKWEIHITYGLTPFILKAELEYHRNQLIRIRVHGKKSSMLLENDYPTLQLTNSKKGIKWKIREGYMDEGNQKNSRLLMNIMDQLEFIVKHEFPYSQDFYRAGIKSLYLFTGILASRSFVSVNHITKRINCVTKLAS